MAYLPLGPALLAVVWALLVARAWLARNRTFGLFTAVVLGVLTLLWAGIAPSLPATAQLPFAVGQLLVWIHYALLARPRRRGSWLRFSVSVPGLWFAAATLLALPWSVAATARRWWPGGAGAADPVPGWWLPWVVATVGVAESLFARRESIEVELSGDGGQEELRRGRARRRRGLHRVAEASGEGEILRIGVLSDPHVGPFLSPERLRRACERLVATSPDLVLFGGDLLTMESQREVDWLLPSLEPLRSLEGRAFGCLGNHDLEDLDTVRTVLDHAGVRLLVDEAAQLGLAAGPVQVVGLQHRWRDRAVRHRALLEELGPTPEGVLRLVLLHDPTGFAELPPGAADLVVSGHTHGGQVGLVSVGLRWTVLRWLTPSIPDHGVWRHRGNTLYVHRGLGMYGFPLRVGVPGEESVLLVRRGRPARDTAA